MQNETAGFQQTSFMRRAAASWTPSRHTLGSIYVLCPLGPWWVRGCRLGACLSGLKAGRVNSSRVFQSSAEKASQIHMRGAVLKDEWEGEMVRSQRVLK